MRAVSTDGLKQNKKLCRGYHAKILISTGSHKITHT